MPMRMLKPSIEPQTLLYVDGRIPRSEGDWLVVYTHNRGGQPGKHVFSDSAAFRALATSKHGIEVDPSILDELEVRRHGWFPTTLNGTNRRDSTTQPIS